MKYVSDYSVVPIKKRTTLLFKQKERTKRVNHKFHIYAVYMYIVMA